MTPATVRVTDPRSVVGRARRSTMRVIAVGITGVVGVVLLGGCAGTSGIGSSGNDQGFVSGDGTLTTVASADRKTPGALTGTTLSGDEVSLADYRGKVVVVNVWGQWCAECHAEAPALARAARKLTGTDVTFLGIDTRDPEQTQPRLFESRYDIPYPSIYDRDGQSLLAFHGTLPLNAIPSTVVIDREGRVAASVTGPVTSASTLEAIVSDVLGRGTEG